MSVISQARALPQHVRFGARTLGFAAYALGTYAVFQATSAPEGTAEDDVRVRKAMRRFGRDLCTLFGVDAVTRGVPPEGFVPGTDAEGKGRIFVVNHRSGFDILLTLAKLEGRHVSRADLAKWPVIGLVARRAGVLFVDRENRRSAAAVMQSMIDHVTHGHGIVIFPEGTTFPGDEVRELKAGAFTVARRTGCEIVPVGVAYGGAGSAYEENDTFLEHMQRVSGRPSTRVAMVVGEPFRGEGVDSHVLALSAQKAIQSLVYEARAML